MVKQCCSAMEGKGQTTKSWSYQCEFKSNCDTLKGTSIKYKFWEKWKGLYGKISYNIIRLCVELKFVKAFYQWSVYK